MCWINRSGSPSGHQMICTGYNSNGVPVLNGHNDDMFRVPYTVAESVAASLDTEAHNNDGLYTILVVTDDFHYHETFSYGSYTTSYHYGTCKHCRNQYSEEHTYKYEWNSINHWFGCESCNYKDFYSVHAKSYQSNTVQHWMGCTSCGYKEEVSSHSWCAISDQVEMCLVCNRRRSV